MARQDPADKARSDAIRQRILEWRDAQEGRAASDTRQKKFIWDRVEGATRVPRATLTHDQIARAGIEIADAAGLDAVSMRSLAKRLGVATMGIYRYVAGKEDVFELMLDAAYGEISLLEEAATHWRVTARAFADQSRSLCLRHPWLIEVTARIPHAITPNMMGIAEHWLASIDGLGLDVDSMMAVFTTVNSFVRGATAGEVAQREASRQEGSRRAGLAPDQDARIAAAPHVLYLMGTGRYPTMSRYILEGSNEDDAQWQFEFGLECVLDGIAARLGI